MKSWVKDSIAVLISILAVSIFFSRFFWPEPMLLATPDFGSSDAWHASFPMKYALWEALQEGRFPLWNTFIGGGFPLLAEGQVGAFYLPNLLLFSLPDPVAAYNLSLALSILTIGLGTYFLLRVMGLSTISSLFGGLTYAFGGLPIAHLTHITLLQGMSLLPILLAITHIMLTRGPIPWLFLWALVASQQIFTGFPQGVFITMILCGAYTAWHTISTRRLRGVVYIVVAAALTIGAAAVQLLPSYEFLKASQFPQGFDAGMSSYFSFPLKHLITFVNPFALGNPKFGTYKHFLQFDGSVFWENIGYIGLIPLCLAFFAVFQIRKSRFVGFFIIILGGAFLLAWGAHSPLYILFAIWPMTLFRVPSRFLWLAVLAIVYLSSSTMDRFVKKLKKPSIKYVLSTMFVAGHIAFLMSTWWSYHLLVAANTWLPIPQSVQNIGKGRIYTIGGTHAYGRIYNQQGWSDVKPYTFMELGAIPDINLIWNVPQQGVKAGRYLLRPSILDEYLSYSIRIDQNQATLSATAQTLLNQSSVRTILSFFPLTYNDLEELQSYSYNDKTLTVYDNPSAAPRAYLVSEATSAATLSQAISTLSQVKPKGKRSALLEDHEVMSDPALQQLINTTASPGADEQPALPIFLRDEHEYIQLSATNGKRAALLVLTDTYYPGWNAYIDGVRTPIFVANLSQRAVMVPPGDHTITFQFQPTSLLIGQRISIAFYLVIILLTVVHACFSLVRTGGITHLPGHYRLHNHGR